MNDIVIENQPILSKLLNKINNSLTMSQAYMLVGNNKEELIKNSITFAKVLICPEKYDQKCSKCNICSRISSNTFGEMKIINPINGNKYFIMFNDKPSNTTPRIYVVKIPNKLKYKTIGIKIIARSKIILVIKEVVQYAVKFTKL